MADIKWIKLSTDIFNNRKIKQIEKMPDGDAMIVIWLKILTLAGDINDSGYVYFTKDIPYTDQLLSTEFNRPLSTIQVALRTFQQFGMIYITDDVIYVSNWERYQNIEGMDKIREQTKARVAKFREKKKQQALCGNVTCNDNVTLCNAIEVDKEVDIDIDKSSTVPTLTDIQSYIQSKHYTFSAERFLEYCNGKGWSNISNWKKYADYWQKLEKSGKKRISDTMSRDEGTIKGYMQDLNDPTA